MPAAATPVPRSGLLPGLGAYALWGAFPLVFHQLKDVEPLEVVLHRITWSLVVVLVLLAVRRRPDERLRAVTGAQAARLAVGGILVASNWLVYVWAVGNDRVVESALGYYINPLFTVALGVVVLGERLARAQVVALGLGAAAVAVLGVAYGRPPWVALSLAATFSAYSFVKKSVAVPAVTALAVETAALAPFAVVGLVALQVRGTASFGHGSGWRDLLLLGLGVVTAVPLLLFATAARRLPLSVLGLLQYATPSLQLACGVLVFGEPMPPARLAGFALVWVALAVLAWDALRRSRGAAPPSDHVDDVAAVDGVGAVLSVPAPS